MKIEIEFISNGWVVKHNIHQGIYDKEVFFRTINQAVAYTKKMLEKYRRWQDE